MGEEWEPDILGPGFARRTLPLDAEGGAGGLVATLVRRRPHPLAAWTGPLGDTDVLYVHGWSDYFFQRDLAAFWAQLGATFFALDLHRYGRSLRPGDVPGYADGLDEYDADIAAALAVIRAGRRGKRRLVLLGHSTGGLTLTLWAARHAGEADALVLNSPWLELQLGPLARQALAPLVAARARFQPRGAQPVVDLGFYTRAQRELGTLPDAPEGWRPERGFATHPGWLSAVLAGHTRVSSGVDVGCPTLVLLSDRSTPPIRWVPEMIASDSVLAVDEIARAATRIEPLMTLGRIPGAIHDVFLSAPAATADAYATMRRWVEGVLR